MLPRKTTMKFQYKSDDGEVRLLKLNEMQNPSTSLVRNPRQGTTCSFKILKLSNFSTEHNETDGRGNKLVRSAYCPDVDPERCVNADIVSATIGLTSVSELDRLLEVCLTKLHVGESGEFGITCSRSKSLFNISLKLVSIEGKGLIFLLSNFWACRSTELILSRQRYNYSLEYEKDVVLLAFVFLWKFRITGTVRFKSGKIT